MSKSENSGVRIGGVALLVLGVVMSVGGLIFYIATNEKARGHGGFYIPGFLPIACIFGGIGVITAGIRAYRSAGQQKKTKKTRVVEGNIKVFQEADSHSALVATLGENDEIKVEAAKYGGGIRWAQITLPDGKTGYMLGDVKVYKTLKAETVGAETLIYQKMNASEQPILKLPAGSQLEIDAGQWNMGASWIKVLLPGGEKGFIRRGIKVNWI